MAGTFGVGIKNIQRGTISVTNGNTTNTDTITSVDTAKSLLTHLGDFSDTSALQSSRGYIELTNATTITATRSGSTDTWTVSYEVVEYY